MSILENFTKKVSETTKAAVKKSGELVEETKLNLSIRTEESKIEKVYTEIGRIVYESFSKGEEVDEAFKENCEKIKAYEESIKEMKDKILDIKNIKMCQACNAELEADVVFCPKCGAKQEMPKPPVVEESEEKKCPACNCVIETYSAFCSKCGAKL